jgi:hypothetical protein
MEIGQISLLIDFGGFFLGVGTIVDSFHNVANMPWYSEALNIAQTGSANHGEKSCMSQFGTLTGPVNLKTLTWLSLQSTEYGSVVYSDGTSGNEDLQKGKESISGEQLNLIKSFWYFHWK